MCASEITRRTADRAAVDEVVEELFPGRLVLRVTDIDVEDLTTTVAAQTGSDHDRFQHDPPVLTDMDVGRAQPHVDERLVIQPARPQHEDVGVDLVQIRDTVDFEIPSHNPAL